MMNDQDDEKKKTGKKKHSQQNKVAHLWVKYLNLLYIELYLLF